jgi:hypothetical protein
MKEGSTVDALPVDSVSYQANATFGSGTELGTGNFVVAAGRDSSVTITGLNAGSTYSIKAFEFSGLAGEEEYLQSNAPEVTATAAVNTTLTDIQPERNAHSIPTDSDISLTFDQPVQTSSVNDSTSIRVLSRERGRITGSFMFSNSNQTVTYTPDEAFTPGEQLSVVVNGDSLLFENPAVINSENIRYQVKTNRSTGRFDSSRVNTDLTGLDNPLYPIPYDMNGDGWNDLVLESNYRVGEFNNEQDSTYTYSTLINSSDAGKIRVGDVNNDGYADIVFNLTVESHLKVYFGQPGGSYVLSETLILLEDDDLSSWDLRDMNNDGWLDIIALLESEEKTISVWHNQKDGTFAEEITKGFASGYFEEFTIADYNNDGHLDLAMFQYVDRELYIVTGTDSSAYTVQATGLTVSDISYENGIASVDLNNDNLMDIVALDIDYGTDTYEIALYSNNGDNTFSRTGSVDTIEKPEMVKTGDLNGDGYQDVVVLLYLAGSDEYKIAVYEGSGDGTFTQSGTYSTGQYGDAINLADMNADGTLDIVVTGPGSYGLRTYYNAENPNAEVTLTGNEGWRLISTPFTDVSYANTFEDLWTQGITGADTENGTANIYTWGTETATSDATNWQAVSNMSDSLKLGSGALIYVYSDDNYDQAGDAGFPKTLSVDGTPNDTTQDLSSMLNTNTNGWTLLGNPFTEDIDWDKIERSNLSNSVYVYDPNGAGWKTWNGTTGSLTDGQISRLNGFFVQTMASSPTLTVPDTAKIGDNGVFRGKQQTESDPPKIVSLEITNEDGSTDETWFQFSNDGLEGQDPADAVQLAPLNAQYVVLASTLSDTLSADINHLPIPEQELHIPLEIQSSSTGTHELALRSVNLPEGWQVQLYDEDTETRINLDEPYSFDYQMAKQKSGQITPATLSNPVMKTKSSSSNRFSVVVSPSTVTANQDTRELPTKVALQQNYPNPFNPSTTIKYQLPVTGPVSLQVFNALGQEVAILVNERKAAGYHQVNFDASRLASGMYIYRLTAGNKVITKKFTLIK